MKKLEWNNNLSCLQESKKRESMNIRIMIISIL